MTVPTQIQVIDIPAGGVEYVGVTITEDTGKDISGDTITLGVSDYYTAPTAWVAPDSDRPQTDLSQRVVALLIGGAVQPDSAVYYLWSKVGDSPEVVVRRHQRFLVINTT